MAAIREAAQLGIGQRNAGRIVPVLLALGLLERQNGRLVNAADVDRFRKLAQPVVRKYLEAEVSKEWTDKLVQAADSTRKQ